MQMKYAIFSDIQKTCPNNRTGFIYQQGQKDSNPRHLVLETNVLPTELYPYIIKLSSPSRARTYDPPVNSRLLYHWAIEDYSWFRQPPTFPGRLQPSIIGRLCLNLRVRYGYGCLPQSHYHRKFSTPSKLNKEFLSSPKSFLVKPSTY